MTDADATPFTDHWAVHRSDTLELTITLDPSPDHPALGADLARDPVALWCACLERGMWGGAIPAQPPYLEPVIQADNARVTWSLALQTTDVHSLRPLWQLLKACRPRRLSLTSRQTDANLEAVSPPTPPPFPDMPAGRPFTLTLDPPPKSGIDRGVCFTWRDPLTEARVRTIYADLRLWCELVNAGAFPNESGDSGVLFEAPMMDDAWSVVLMLPVFSAHEAAWHALVRYALRAHDDHPLEAVHIF